MTSKIKVKFLTAVSFFLCVWSIMGDFKDGEKSSDRLIMKETTLQKGLNCSIYNGKFNSASTLYISTPKEEIVVNNFRVPKKLQGKDRFGLEFFGVIKILKAGEYNFYTSSDDGSKLYIGQKLVVDNDGLHSKEEKSGKISLDAGFYPIYVSYIEGIGDEVLEVQYEGPNIVKQAISDKELFQYRRVLTLPVINTNMGIFNEHSYEKAIDGNMSTYCQSSLPPEKGTLFEIDLSTSVSLDSIKVISGSENGDNIISGGSLSAVEDDGQLYSADFKDGLAELILKGKRIKTLSIKLTTTHKNPIIIREIVIKNENGKVLNLKSPILKYAAPLVVNLNVIECPNLRKEGERYASLILKNYQKISLMLDSKYYKHPRALNLIIRKTLKGAPAWCSAAGMELNGKWFRKKPNDVGCIIHELTHIVQSYTCGPTWITEGIADYIRHKIPHDDGWKLSLRYRKGDKYTIGYWVTASFFVFIEKKYDKDIVKKLNRAMQKGEYKDELFKNYTGKSLDNLWEEYKEYKPKK